MLIGYYCLIIWTFISIVGFQKILQWNQKPRWHPSLFMLPESMWSAVWQYCAIFSPIWIQGLSYSCYQTLAFNAKHIPSKAKSSKEILLLSKTPLPSHKVQCCWQYVPPHLINNTLSTCLSRKEPSIGANEGVGGKANSRRTGQKSKLLWESKKNTSCIHVNHGTLARVSDWWCKHTRLHSGARQVSVAFTPRLKSIM